MTREDVNRMFTERVAELIAQGYHINTGSMPGSQGEIAKVDLRKGSEIIRVLLEHKCGFGDRNDYDGYFSITTGRYTKKLRDDWGDTIWNHELEPISEIRLARISNTFFVTLAEAAPMAAKRLERWKASGGMGRLYGDTHKILGEAFKSIALRYIQRQPRMRTCTLADIEQIRKIPPNQYSPAAYKIRARGKDFIIRARQA